MPDEQHIPPLLSGWQTGGMRRKQRGGHNITHDKNIRVLAETLAGDIAQQVTNGNREEAAARVEANLIGMRQGKSGPPAMAASPDAQRILDEQEAPPLSSGWQTAHMRAKERGGKDATHDKNIRVLAGTLAGDIAQQVTNGNREEAAARVEANLIGMRQGKKGPAALAASPDAQRILDKQEASSHTARLHLRRPPDGPSHERP